jgi:catechol 2,3-dioxygenase-like lactoylglutathione lyase family enzyme
MKLLSSIPALPVREIPTAVRFYQDRMGFTLGYHDEGFAIITRDAVELHLWAANDDGWREKLAGRAERPVVSGAESFLAGTASCRIAVQGIDELFVEYENSGVLYDAGTSVTDQPWGTREFPALDLDRNLLTFYET